MSFRFETRFLFNEVHHDPARGWKIDIRDWNVWYGEKRALKDVTLSIAANEVTAFIGPSGCGKSTLLKSLNRMNEIIRGVTVSGTILIDGQDIYDPDIELPRLRRRFGWIAQMPNPFPWSVHENVAYGAAINGIVQTKAETDDWVEDCLRRANLWNEVKDNLQEVGTALSGGQQQRLCIARALSAKPDILLMDEPCSALDPTATALVEDLIDTLRQTHTIIIVTHNMQQAARVSQRAAFFDLGEVVEVGETASMFLTPRTERCSNYITGRYG